MEMRGGLSAPLLTGTTMQRRLYFNTTDATGKGAENVSRTIVTKSLTATTKTSEDRYEATMKRTRFLQKAVYQVIEVWAFQVGKIDAEPPRAETKSYPHAILYDLEAYGDNHWKEPTPTLTIENAHVPANFGERW